MKTCRKCEAHKPQSEYYPHRLICKRCCTAASGAWGRTKEGRASRKRAKAKYRATTNGAVKDKAYRESSAGRLAQKRGKKAFAERHPGIYKIYKERYYEKYPEKRAAKEALRAAVRYGKIEKPNNCQECGQEALIHGHHTDYSKPLDVAWLCQTCHVRAHHGA